MRIGALAKAVGTTVRTVRYYEEIGLMPADERVAGEHREYDESDVERLRELLRLKGLLGLSLDELRDVMAGGGARAERRRGLRQTSHAAPRERPPRGGVPRPRALLSLAGPPPAELRG